MSELAQLLWQELSQLEQSASLNPWRILDYGLGDSDPSLTQAAFDELNLNPSEFLNSWTLNKAVTVSLQ